MECTLNKIQYFGKAETPFNICLNNHRLNASDPNPIPACHHFTQNNLQFSNHVKFTLIETITNRSIP